MERDERKGWRGRRERDGEGGEKWMEKDERKGWRRRRERYSKFCT